MIDTHAHLTQRFCDVTREVLDEAKNEGVNKIVLAASNIKDSSDNVYLAKKYAGFLMASVGIHPQDTDPGINLSIDQQVEYLDGLINNNRQWICSVGECGLDYSKAPEGEKDRTKEEQERLFRAQICLAEKYKLPLIVHARKAVDETVDIIHDYNQTRGVLHCYTGGKKRINRVLDLSSEWYFGIDGNLTYENGLEDVVKSIPKDRLVLETDSPFLTPYPFRGQKNTPAKIKYIYQKVAEIWNLELDKTVRIIDDNAKNLFDLK